MPKKILLILSILFSFLLSSCSKNYKEVSESEFINNILPNIEINNMEVNKNEVIVHTNEEKGYKVKLDSPNSVPAFLNKIASQNKNFSVLHDSSENTLILLTLLPLVFPLIILIHIILLTIALSRIIKSEINSVEKLVYTIISLFFIVIGPIIYLTTKKSNRYQLKM